ncbi:hypothetical protein AB4328_15885, partial [Vibrio breoganii]
FQYDGVGELNPYMGKGGEECLLKHFISAVSVSLPTSTLNRYVILSSTQDLRTHRVDSIQSNLSDNVTNGLNTNSMPTIPNNSSSATKLQTQKKRA